LNRLQDRLRKIWHGKELPTNFDVTTEAPGLANGLIELLENYLSTHPDTKLIVMDTLQKIRSGAIKNETAYSCDYRELGQIKALADKHSLCILLVHHLRKMKSDNLFDMLSGTNGVRGTADTNLILSRTKKENEAILLVEGRDIPQDEYILAMDQNTCRWHMIGSIEQESERRQFEAHNTSPIVKTLLWLLGASPDGIWCGTASGLFDAVVNHTGVQPAESIAVFAKNLKAIKQRLQDHNDIVYTPPSPNGSGGTRTHTFELMSPLHP